MGDNKVYSCSKKMYNIQNPSGKQQQQAAVNEDSEDWTFIINKNKNL